jgi:methyl-accepting chemotaxis protein
LGACFPSFILVFVDQGRIGVKLIGNLTAGRQLTLAWALTLGALVVMGVLMVTNLLALKSASEALARQESLNSALVEAEFRFARQENSYRGHLLSAEAYYIARLETHRAEFKKALEAARLDTPQEHQATIDQALRAADDWRRNVALAGQALIAQGRMVEAEQLVGQVGVSDRYVEPVEGAINTLKEVNAVALEASRQAQVEASRNAVITLTGGLASAILMALLMGLAMSRTLARSTFGMVGLLQKLRASEAAP